MTAAVIAAATRAAISASRHSAKSDGPEPDRLQPRAPASTAARLISAGPARATLAAAPRWCPRARARSARSRRDAGRRRARRYSPIAGRRRERHGVAEQRTASRRFDFEIGMDDDGGQARRNRQPDRVGRIGAAHQDESSVDARRDVVGVRRPGAEPLAFERTRRSAFRSACARR